MSSFGYDRWADIVDREACGEALGDDERTFAREFERTDAEARAEAELFAELARVSHDQVAEHRVAQAAVAAVLAGRAAARRRTLFVACGGLAAAAAAAFWMSSAARNVAEAPLAASVVEYTDGAVAVDGKAAALGTRVSVGSEVQAVSGVACVAVEPTIHVCLAPGAKMRVQHVGNGPKQVDLVSGSLATALNPLPEGQQFSIVARDTWVTAVGTAFSVELLESSVRTVVHEGKVRVGNGTTGPVLPAHKIGLSTASGTRAEELVDHASTESAEWKVLARVANRSIEAPFGATEAAVETAPSSTKEAPVARSAAERRAPKPEALPREAQETASDLLARARQALRDQSWSDAAGAYREIIGRFPASPEARTVVVSLARLEIDRLGQPSSALSHLDSYLASGGALEMEARLERIRAYRALGRTADEARAITEFLDRHPSSLEAPRLRERLSALGGAE